VPGLDQPRQIAFRRMHRHPAHRDRRAFMLAARGERDIEAGSGNARIIEEQFEKIAHPVEEQAILGFRLQRQILRHHRGGGGHRPSIGSRALWRTLREKAPRLLPNASSWSRVRIAASEWNIVI